MLNGMLISCLNGMLKENTKLIWNIEWNVKQNIKWDMKLKW